MLIGFRIFEAAGMKGLQALLIRDWKTPFENYADPCFQAFDESLIQLRNDPQATRLTDEDPLIGDLKTATQRARRSFNDYLRPLADLYTIAWLSKSERPHRLMTNFPPWLLIQLENIQGTLAHLESSERTLEWRSLPLEKEDFWIHVSAFSALHSISLGAVPSRQVWRLSHLLEPGAPTVRLSAPLQEFHDETT